MATMLRHTPTGDIYPYNADLARRDDMVQYVPPPEGSVEKPVEVAEVEEEIVIEQPKIVQPVIEQPKIVQPVIEQPKIVQPVKVAKKSQSKTEDELPNLDDL